MKFTDIVILYVVAGVLIISTSCGLRLCDRIGKESDLRRQESICMRFVSESFRNTCKGKGFKNLNEWQIICRALWKLDYIGWAKAEEFMIDEAGKTENELFYGKWNGFCGQGEVFCRARKDSGNDK